MEKRIETIEGKKYRVSPVFLAPSCLGCVFINYTECSREKQRICGIGENIFEEESARLHTRDEVWFLNHSGVHEGVILGFDDDGFVEIKHLDSFRTEMVHNSFVSLTPFSLEKGGWS